jgi:hypothetical protein
MEKRRETKMSRTIRINTTERPSTLVARAQGIKKYGVDFKGDTTSGSFSGKGVKGTYWIQGRGVTVTITGKPSLIPWGIVESQVRAFFDLDDGGRNIPARRYRRRTGRPKRQGRTVRQERLRGG